MAIFEDFVQFSWVDRDRKEVAIFCHMENPAISLRQVSNMVCELTIYKYACICVFVYTRVLDGNVTFPSFSLKVSSSAHV